MLELPEEKFQSLLDRFDPSTQYQKCVLCLDNVTGYCGDYCRLSKALEKAGVPQRRAACFELPGFEKAFEAIKYPGNKNADKTVLAFRQQIIAAAERGEEKP